MRTLSIENAEHRLSKKSLGTKLLSTVLTGVIEIEIDAELIDRSALLYPK